METIISSGQYTGQYSRYVVDSTEYSTLSSPVHSTVGIERYSIQYIALWGNIVKPGWSLFFFAIEIGKIQVE